MERPDTLSKKVWDILNDDLKAKVIEHEQRHEELMANARALVAKAKEQDQ
jgi:hypothetical protein